jgi:hypothetical protein
MDETKVQEGRKKNGHKATCACHICQNMKAKAARRGYTEELQRKNSPSTQKNGHKTTCMCPICKNIKAKREKGRSRRRRRRH